MNNKDLQTFIEKMDQLKKQEKMDLSCDEDLSFAIMNLISIEEHFIFTGAKTERNKYYDFVDEIRSIRKELLQKIVKDPEGEVWCISKHLLATCMRLMEVGTKQLSLDKKNEAYDFFQKAYDMYALFWGLNMHVIDADTVKLKNDELSMDPIEKPKKGIIKSLFSRESKKKSGELDNSIEKTNKGIVGSLRVLVKKAINCCIE